MRGNSQVTSASLRDSARPLARSSVSSNSRGFMRSGTSPFSMSMANCQVRAHSSGSRVWGWLQQVRLYKGTLPISMSMANYKVLVEYLVADSDKSLQLSLRSAMPNEYALTALASRFRTYIHSRELYANTLQGFAYKSAVYTCEFL